MGLKIGLLVAFFVIFLFDVCLSILSYRYKKPLPDNVKDVYDEETYSKQKAYKAELLRHKIFKNVFGSVVFLCILGFDVYSLVFDFALKFSGNVYMQTVLMFVFLSIVDSILDIPFDLVETFKIEQKYGFNKKTVKTFIVDFVLKLILFIGLMIAAILLLMSMYAKYGYWAFAILFGAIIGVMLIIALFYKQISKTMNKFTPLEEGELKTKIEEFAKKEGFSIKKLSVMNASKRSTRVNAYCSGIGKFKSIVLFDTLIESATDDEILAILAHEIGHAKRSHGIKGMAIGIIHYVILVALACFVVVNKDVSVAFGFKDLNIAFNIIVFMTLFSPIGMLLAIPSNFVARHHENQADEFVVLNNLKEPFVSGLKKLSAKNFSELTPHPLVVLIKYNHPPLSQRLEFIENVKM